MKGQIIILSSILVSLAILFYSSTYLIIPTSRITVSKGDLGELASILLLEQAVIYASNYSYSTGNYSYFEDSVINYLKNCSNNPFICGVDAGGIVVECNFSSTVNLGSNTRMVANVFSVNHSWLKYSIILEVEARSNSTGTAYGALVIRVNGTKIFNDYIASVHFTKVSVKESSSNTVIPTVYYYDSVYGFTVIVPYLDSPQNVSVVIEDVKGLKLWFKVIC
ncbi:MAG: hypothetical protein DRJ31_11055 [Candidatus Methanomethylicota archaeon]|uniref:Uncharacterized protein n=1 Tax=Thermoproteota archaeon TaxID=2056631 RepID=A0A497EJL8_9CREN|nr:MAG: hypothetical protein DRJ31_11055 [Candidatus Verstraetearchaeota archaeon]